MPVGPHPSPSPRAAAAAVGADAASGMWRQELATFAPELARLPPSMLAVNLLLLRRRVAAARAACDEWLLSGRMTPRDLLTVAERSRQSGDLESALDFRRRAYRCEMSALGLREQDLEQAVRFCLAADGHGDPVTSPPRGYVQAVFDRYAETFEARLVDELDYRGPSEVYRLLAEQLQERFAGRKILDMGCGTGLAGSLYRPHAALLDGVDLSPAMIEQARGKGLYDQLWVGDLQQLPASSANRYDLILAVDVFIYIGELSVALAACRHLLGDGGILAASFETGGEGCRLVDRRRYAHSVDYVCQQAAAGGWELLRVEQVSLRRERGRPLDFFVVLFAASKHVDPRDT
ncbi:MAG: methyltransferase domain-containing protein, partial [Planctomycetales bacterium]|nr:methyltransferase domain-containing protein [Planctomycetales bacterium]